MSVNTMKFSSLVNREDATNIIRVIFEAFQKGTLNLTKEDESLDLVLPPALLFALKASTDGATSSLSLNLSWDMAESVENPETSTSSS